MKDQVGTITTELMLSINRFLDVNVNFLPVLDPDLDLESRSIVSCILLRNNIILHKDF